MCSDSQHHYLCDNPKPRGTGNTKSVQTGRNHWKPEHRGGPAARCEMMSLPSAALHTDCDTERGGGLKESLGDSAPSCSEQPSCLPGRFPHFHFHVFQFWSGSSRADLYMNSLQGFHWNACQRKFSKKERPNSHTAQSNFYFIFTRMSYTTVLHERLRTRVFIFHFF